MTSLSLKHVHESMEPSKALGTKNQSPLKMVIASPDIDNAHRELCESFSTEKVLIFVSRAAYFIVAHSIKLSRFRIHCSKTFKLCKTANRFFLPLLPRRFILNRALK